MHTTLNYLVLAIRYNIDMDLNCPPLWASLLRHMALQCCTPEGLRMHEPCMHCSHDADKSMEVNDTKMMKFISITTCALPEYYTSLVII